MRLLVDMVEPLETEVPTVVSKALTVLSEAAKPPQAFLDLIAALKTSLIALATHALTEV